MHEWVLHHIDAADRAVLTDYTFEPIPPDLAAVQFSDAATAGDFALLARPGPNTVVTLVAWAMKLLRQNTGETLIANHVGTNPRLPSAKGDAISALQTYATLDARGNAYLIVINADPARDITATVTPLNIAYGRKVAISTLASPSITDENDRSRPTRVAIKQQAVHVGEGSLQYTFPRHSITAIKWSRR
jgi:alpha-N-arabinofuranosidase